MPYVQYDPLVYPKTRISFTRKYEIPVQLNDDYNEFTALKLKPYKDLYPEDFVRIEELSTELEPYIFNADDINLCCQSIMDMEDFIIDEFPAYINDIISKMWIEFNKAIGEIDDKKDEIDDWWSKIRLSINLKTFVWDNWLSLPDVDYYTTKFENNKIIETLKFKNDAFGTYTTIFLNDGSITETIVITDPYDNTTLYNRTKTTIFNSDGTIKESVREN